MLGRILTAVGVTLLGLSVGWLVASAGVGMKAPDITNDTWLNSAPTSPFPSPSTTTSPPGIDMVTAIGRRCI